MVTATEDATNTSLATDGKGNAIIVWNQQNGAFSPIYASLLFSR